MSSTPTWEIEFDDSIGRTMTFWYDGERFVFHNDALKYVVEIGRQAPTKESAWRRTAAFGRRLEESP